MGQTEIRNKRSGHGQLSMPDKKFGNGQSLKDYQHASDMVVFAF